MAQSIFRKESIDKVSSPEQLNDYIKISSAGIWAILAAVIILLVCGGIWVVFGSLNTTVNVDGVVQNGYATCYVADASEILTGQTVLFSDGTQGVVESIDETPESKEQIKSLYDEYTAYTLNLSDWNYAITVSAPDSKNGTISAEITVDKISPVSFIWKN